ncbi:MAG: hypothetical protein DWQ07_16285 [Chloroflexi bacterium]|nr:MAG: hypothetical protein DWQ07_16285 [Chloroflexota bacterium]MBL1195311.1 hypothetical protein [Chloroflexota bacterium]NOH12595.1 prolyl oligopeptidase family serine peptidase [Chloroflexota bacterium]
MKIRWPRFIFRLGFALLAAYLFLNLALAWSFSYPLTHPNCNPPTDIPSNRPQPEELEITTHDGHLLDAWYFPSGNGALVVTLPGHGGTLGLTNPDIGFLLEQGYGVLQIESRACAEPAAPVTLGYHETSDAILGLDRLLAQGEIDLHTIAIFGHSMGGVTAIRAAAQDKRFAAVIADGGFYNLGEDFVNSATSWWDAGLLYSVAATFWLQTGVNPWQISPIDDLPHIHPRPVFLIYGEHEIESGYGYQQYEAALQPKTLWVVPDGYHGGNQTTATEEYEQRILEFLSVSLGPSH